MKASRIAASGANKRNTLENRNDWLGAGHGFSLRPGTG
jgi:hypothetical protein